MNTIPHAVSVVWSLVSALSSPGVSFGDRGYEVVCNAVLLDASGVVDPADTHHTYTFKGTCRIEVYGTCKQGDTDCMRRQIELSSIQDGEPRYAGLWSHTASPAFEVLGTAEWTLKTGEVHESLKISGPATGRISGAYHGCLTDPFLKGGGGCSGSSGNANATSYELNHPVPWENALMTALYQRRFPIMWRQFDFNAARAFSAKHTSSPKPAPPPEPTAVSKTLVLEGEQLVSQAQPTAGKVLSQTMTALGSGWSGNAQLFWRDGTPGSLLRLPLNIDAESWYGVAMLLTKAPDYANLRVWVDGKQLGPTFYGYSGTASPSGWTDFGEVFLSRGSHDLALEIIGKERTSKGYFVGVDNIHLTPMSVIEGETVVKDAKVTAGSVGQQPMAGFGKGWSGNSQLFWQGAGPGGQLTIPVVVPARDWYRVRIEFTRAPDFGDVQLLVDGQKVGPVFSGFDSRVSPSGPVEFGSLSLNPGSHTLSLMIVGKRSTATNYFVGVDRIIFVRGRAQTMKSANDR